MPVAYVEGTPPDWGVNALKSAGGWKAEKAGGRVVRYVLHGKCPRCENSDGLDGVVPGELVLTAAAGFDKGALELAADAANDVVYVACTTTSADITNRPSGARGCGAAGDVPLVAAP